MENEYDRYEALEEQFVEWLKNRTEVYRIRDGFSTIDFSIGHTDAWYPPLGCDGEKIRCVRGSSIATGLAVSAGDSEQFVNKANIHLPPTTDEVGEEVRSALELDGIPFDVVFGTKNMSFGRRKIDGVALPHVILDRSRPVSYRDSRRMPDPLGSG